MCSKMQKFSSAPARNGSQAAQAAAADHHDLAGLEVALVGGADQIEGAGLAGDHPGPVEAAEGEGPEAARVARRDQRVPVSITRL